MASKIWQGTDGDWGTAGNWSPSGVPTAGDDVRIPAGSGAITSSLNQSAVALGDVIVESGYASNIGSSSASLQIDPDRFEFAATGGAAYIDIGSAAIDVTISSTGTASVGYRALYLIGSAIDVLSIRGGSVGIAAVHGTTATVATLRVQGGEVWMGEGCTLTTVDCNGGNADIRCAATTIRVSGGTLTTSEEGAVTTMTVNSGNAVPCSTGTITTLNVEGGSVDFYQCGQSRTVTTLNHNGGTVRYDPNVMTFTTINEADKPVSVTVTAV